MRQFKTAVAFGVLLTLLGGCVDFGSSLGVQPPTADYRDFKVAALSTDAIDFDLGFELGNPNQFALPVATLDWDLTLFDAPFSYGQILFEDADPNAPEVGTDGSILTYLGVQSIPAGGAMELNTPFSVALLDTFEGILRVAAGDDIPYSIGGVLHFESLVGTWDLPFEASGVWSNAELSAFIEDVGGDFIDDIFN